MPGSTNTHTQNYISRVLSFKGNEIQTNNNRKLNYKRLNEELRQHIGKLKGELEMEKNRSKQTHRDKVMEMKRIRDEFDLKYQLSLEEASTKFNNTKDTEMKKLKEILTKEKEQEIKQIIKFKDEEIKILQKTFSAEKERAIKDFELKLTSSSTVRNRTSSDASEKLKLELADLQNHRESLESKCKEFSQMLAEKNNFIEEMKGKHNREIQRVLREARRENSRSISDLNKIKKDLDQKNGEMIKLEHSVKKVSEEKEQLLQKIRKGKITSQHHDRHAFSMSNLNDPDAFIDKVYSHKILHFYQVSCALAAL